DEMQDINELQFEIIKLLLQEEQNIFAVGDDDQSIYEFRGSKPDIMLNFQKAFKNTAIVKLNINYRSLRQIITAANCLINKNVHRFQKDCRCFLNQYGSIHYLQFENEAKQAHYIIQKVKETKKKIGILFRNKQDALILNQMLEWQHIPYYSKEQINQSMSFSVIEDLLAYFKLAYNLNEEKCLRQLYKKPKGNLEALKHISFFAGVNFIRKGIGYDSYLYNTYKGEPYLYESAIELCEFFQKEVETLPKSFSVKDMIAHFDAFCIQNKYKVNSQEESNVHLYTFHGSKGLEFDEVFCINTNEGIVPSGYNELGIEEERRMFYVAITRAKFSLYVCCIKNRGGKEYQPSRFINEMKY
ncbi:MAG: ATP-dependent helicase, partial [Lachnospiraceae bacterium]|nr:ATP-dependent helicase [Lachnospiraceae bacterium]